MAIQWNENLETGVELIDTQHKELFSRFDTLLTACNQGKGRVEVLRLLLFLDDYIKSHFAAEEQLQIRCNYPGYEAHKELHNRFVQDVDRLEAQFRTEGATLPLVIQTNQALSAWLIKHIRQIDMEFAGFLKSSSL